MKEIINRLRMPRWPIILYVVIGLVSLGLLWWRLGTLVVGFSQPELEARAAANSIHKIIGNPLFMPYRLLQYGLLRLGHHGAFWMRLVSTFFAGLIVVAFYQILRGWYSGRVALLCSFLFLTSAWLLHYGRIGTPEVTYGTSIALLWVGVRLKSNAPRFLTLLVGGAASLSLLYVPGMVWIIGVLVFWQRQTIKENFKKLAIWPKLLLIFGSLVGLAPLLHGLIRHPSLLRAWSGLPLVWSPTRFISNAWHLPVWLTLQGPRMPVFWLGHLPLLDVFSVSMLALGVFVLSHHTQLDRVRTMALILAVGAVLTILNGPVLMFIMAPILYLITASGIALLLQQWFTVFPQNPLARSLGIFMVSLVVAMAAFYNLQHYFIAWPRATVTKQVFGILER